VDWKTFGLVVFLLLGWAGSPVELLFAALDPLSSATTKSNSIAAPQPKAYRQFALLHEGTPSRGKQLFQEEEKIGCTKCHTVDGSAGRAGPDLFAIGDKFGRGDIIDSILYPSQTIAEGYAATTIETKGEDVYTGVIKRATDDWIELMGGDARIVRIATAQIARRFNSEVSLMPEGLASGLSQQEFTDLIEYLVSLKQPQSASLVENGMPTEIPLANRSGSSRSRMTHSSSSTRYGLAPFQAKARPS
jgi:putative heme-binding domain-containing protein